jgi:23S rRNA (uracil1939-C5)-methyltransferase
MATARRMARPVSGRRPGGERAGPRSGEPRAPARPVRLRIESIAAGGEGVGRMEDGRVVFVHRTAPGDLAEVELVQQQKRWARGRLLRVLEPSPERREAPCPHYTECGGCTLEHLTYPAQLRAKARIVADALARIGGIEVPAPAVVPSPREHRYRNRVTFALRRVGAGQAVAGFHAIGDPGRIIEIDGRCLLPEEPIARVWDRLHAAWGPDARRLPSGEQLRLTLRASAAGEVTLLVEGGYSPGRPQELIDSVEGLVAVWHRPGDAAAELVAGAPGLPEQWGEDTVEVSGAAFLQVNRAAAELLEAHVLTVVGEAAGLEVVDAYCGVGLHARRLARRGARVVGVELDPDAVAAARRAAPEGARFEQGAVEQLLGDELPADLVILNPPRAGVAPEVTELLAAAPPPRVVYVSCDPATLARDLRRLAGAFRLEDIRCFDLFPQTAHVETVAVLVRS